MSKEVLISLQSYCKLIIFSLPFLLACRQKKQDASKDLSILWKEDRAVGLSISENNIGPISQDSLASQLEIRLDRPGEQPAIAGNYSSENNEYVFKPLIPFTRGLRYILFVRNQLLTGIEIPKDTIVPKLLAIYPSRDSLPENLLKIYLVFSRPMVEGHSSRYIQLTDLSGDSLPNSFLNLQSELWNEESTILTLWLDPGRIKRDLKPNQLLGPPLTSGRQYKLIISSEWPDKEGVSLMKSYSKPFVAMHRDTVSPSPDSWKLIVPNRGSMEPLQVNLDEPLDYVLLQNSIWLIDSRGKTVKVTIQIDRQEMKVEFLPVKPWSKGSYKLEIEPRLEDLAGNNLNRVFDLDLKSSRKLKPAKKIFEKDWQIN